MDKQNGRRTIESKIGYNVYELLNKEWINIVSYYLCKSVIGGE